MRERFFEQRERVNKKVEAINRELSDAGISDPSEWRKALDLETPLEREEGLEQDGRSLEKIKAKSEIQAGAIDGRHWQRQLDVAFEQGNFSLIQTLQRVRPDNIPNPELVRNKLNDLVISRPSRWEETYRTIREVSNLEADPTVVEGEFTKLLEQLGKEKGILEQLKAFKQATGHTPSAEQVQQKYRNIFAGRKSYSFDTEDLIKDIKGLTGAQPDKIIFQEVVDTGDILQAEKIAPFFGEEVTSEMIQRAYEAQFEKNGWLDIHHLSKIDEKPNPELVQRAYQKIIEKHGNGWMDSVKSLEQATGIKPVFTEEEMRPIFEEYFQNGWYGQKGYIGVEHVTELTGIKAPVDLVEKTALKIVDSGHQYINQGKAIKEGIKKLQESTGVEFEIPESEIQDRYQKAMADKEPHIITSLYGVLGIRPNVDKEEARQFMVGLMTETHHNLIPELEKVFNIRFKATDEEIESKYDEMFDNNNFDGLTRIQELTGKTPDQEKLQVAVQRHVEQQFTKERNQYHPWDKGLKKILEEFSVSIPEDQILSFYRRSVEGESVDTTKIKELNELFGLHMPAGLAQISYKRLIQKGGYISALESVHQLSGGVKPDLSAEEIYAFNLALLENGYTSSIEKLAKITGISMPFKPEDILALYKKLILGGKAWRIEDIKELTGVELELDADMIQHVSQKIQNSIGIAASKEYITLETQHGKQFNTRTLEQDLGEAATLIWVTGIKPDDGLVQAYYQKIFSEDSNWEPRLEIMTKSLGIAPSLPPELLQAKGEQLLEQGALRGFQHLQEYGQFTFTPEIAEKAYTGLLATNRRHDEYDRARYYNNDWIDRIKQLQKLSGIPPTEAQLAEIFFHISQDGLITGSRYSEGVEKTIKFFAENFQTKITVGMVKDIALSYLSQRDTDNLKKFIEKVGIVPEFSDDDLIHHVNRLLEEKKIDTLASLKQTMKLANLPVTEAVVQGAYQYFSSQEDFGKENSRSLQAFKQVFELTGIPANLPPEQVDQIYKSTRFAEWQKLNEVVGGLPSQEIVQYKYLQFFTGRHHGLDKNIAAVHTLTNQSPKAETISKALEHFASEGKIEEMSNIVKIVGGQPTMNPESGQNAYRKIMGQGEEKLIIAINFLNDVCGIRPDSETMYQIYLNIFGRIYYKNAYEGADGKRMYPQFWDYLVKKFGKPDSEIVQRIYLAQLAA